jgi:indolepyruvate ferredoxin oxidoreductase alpha subunit
MSLDFRTEAPILESMIAMGSSVAVAAGVKAADPDRYVVAVVGDSSFYHNGLQGLIDAAYHQTPIVVLILDNEITAQSGFQPDPGTGPSGEPGSGGRRIPLEGVVSALGVEVKVVDAFQPEEVEEALVEALESQECRVVISRGLCPLAEQAGAYPPQK